MSEVLGQWKPWESLAIWAFELLSCDIGVGFFCQTKAKNSSQHQVSSVPLCRGRNPFLRSVSSPTDCGPSSHAPSNSPMNQTRPANPQMFDKTAPWSIDRSFFIEPENDIVLRVTCCAHGPSCLLIPTPWGSNLWTFDIYVQCSCDRYWPLASLFRYSENKQQDEIHPKQIRFIGENCSFDTQSK